MNPQKEGMRANSAALKPFSLNPVSVTAIPAGPWWSVVPQATIPAAVVAAVAVEALQAAAPAVASSFITTEFGRAGVNVLLTRSPFTERDTSAFGVTLQEQHETSC